MRGPMAGERIRVLHVCDKFGIRGSRMHGVSRLFSWWFPRFDRAAFDPVLVQLRGEDDAARHLAATGVPSLSLGKGKFDPTTLLALRRLVRSLRPHVVHVHGYGGCNFGRPVARMEGARIVVHEHAAYPSVPPYQVPVDFALRHMVDVGIAVSASTKDFMVRRRFFAPERIRVVWNGAPLAEFQPIEPERAAAARTRFGIAPGQRVIGTVGRLDAQKGVADLLDAFARLAAHRTDVVLLVVGEGELMEDHRAQARALGVADRVVFTGFSTEIPLLQSLMDVQAFPSIWEGTPLTLFEAMSMRLPIVATTVDGLAEVLRHEENALLVPPRDATALAVAIGRLLDEPRTAGRLAERAHADSRRYDVQATVDALQDVYRELVPQR